MYREHLSVHGASPRKGLKAMSALLELKNISKSYGKVVALRGIDFEVGDNEIVGLVGDNGAGKSTLIKIIMGVVRPDSGDIYFAGKKLKGHSPKKARELGIEPVYQDQALVLKQPLWRNVFLGREKTGRLGFIRLQDVKKQTMMLLKQEMRFAGALNPDIKARYLSGGERQGLAIARALFFQARLVLLDEPTTALSLTETEKVLEFIKKIKETGRSALFISHNIRDICEVSDRNVVFDRGRKVAEYPHLSEEELRTRMKKAIASRV